MIFLSVVKGGGRGEKEWKGGGRVVGRGGRDGERVVEVGVRDGEREVGRMV